MKRWTPAKGAAALFRQFGADAGRACLASLVRGEVGSAEFVNEPWSTVLAHIGNYRAPADRERISTGRDEGTLLDLSRAGNAYWGRSWAARALAYSGDESSAAPLIQALEDHHWRVRMTAAQSLGRLRLRGLEQDLLPLLDDEHPRVRDAAALALERIS